MIDFQKQKVFKLSKSDEKHTPKQIFNLLVDNESVVGFYSGMRDYVVFTNKRIIACNVQGFTGTKKDFTSLPYSKMQAFSVESAGTFDMDSELTLCFSGIGMIKFDFSSNCDVDEINRTIAEYVL